MEREFKWNLSFLLLLFCFFTSQSFSSFSFHRCIFQTMKLSCCMMFSNNYINTLAFNTIEWWKALSTSCRDFFFYSLFQRMKCGRNGIFGKRHHFIRKLPPKNWNEMETINTRTRNSFRLSFLIFFIFFIFGRKQKKKVTQEITECLVDFDFAKYVFRSNR